MKNVTFVSALFDIDRVDGRKWDQYLKWFDGRLTTYKPTGEQLDLLWHDIDDGKFGADAKTGQWYTSIKAIKEKHAKASNLAELKAQIEGMI